MSKKSTALAQPVTGSMAVAGDLHSNAGKEGLMQDDLVFPRVAFAQKTSPQLDPSQEDDFIPGLEMYQMFNTSTGRIYGNSIEFVIIRRTKRAIEFDPAGGVVDFNVALNDPRCQFTTGPNGERIKPRATVFYDYLIAIDNGPDAPPDTCMLSLKTTQIKAAKQLNSLIAVRPGAIYAGKWHGSTTGKKSGSYSFTMFKAKPAGPTPDYLLDTCREMFEATEGVTLDTDDRGRETDDLDDDASF